MKSALYYGICLSCRPSLGIIHALFGDLFCSILFRSLTVLTPIRIGGALTNANHGPIGPSFGWYPAFLSLAVSASRWRLSHVSEHWLLSRTASACPSGAQKTLVVGTERSGGK